MTWKVVCGGSGRASALSLIEGLPTLNGPRVVDCGELRGSGRILSSISHDVRMQYGIEGTRDG
jgi:hypothetical protein